ncbi:MAG: DNA mismatch repair protein MutS [Spirochaetota bacterium]
MKAFLMYRDRDFDPGQPLPLNERELTQDLELETLLNAMALDDEFLFETAKKAVLAGLKDADTILYRQDILRDCMKNAGAVRDIYNISEEVLAKKKKRWFGFFNRYPGGIISGAVSMLQMFVGQLQGLKDITDEHADKFESEGFRRFFAMISEELNDKYFKIIQYHLDELKFKNGVLLSAELGQGNEGKNYILRKPHDKKNKSLVKRIFARKPAYSFNIHPRDEHGARALSELKDRGINIAANALAQSADHIDSFFHMLRTELAFYIGCLNLYEQLVRLEEPAAFPEPAASGKKQHTFNGLYDICLALTVKRKVTGNDMEADSKNLMIITGANQGGKSTFLRSIGLAQLMMQCGMFVPAESFRADIREGVFTHYKRKEDASMKSGKLDEELKRMSGIVDNIKPGSMLLLNESFAATNEREGSEIARQIILALLGKGIKIFFVTHLYEFADGFYGRKTKNILFLRAERQPDKKRTFRIIVGRPLQTSFGEDLYKEIFVAEEQTN